MATGPLEVDHDEMRESEPVVMKTVSTGLGLVFVFFGIFLIDRALTGGNSLEIFHSPIDRIFGCGIFALPVLLSIVIQWRPLKFKNVDGDVLLANPYYLLNPREWWEFFPLWPSVGALFYYVYR